MREKIKFVEGWYSSRIRMILLIEGKGSDVYLDSVFIFKANSFEEAFTRACKIGKSLEEDYVTGEQKNARWRLKEIITVDAVSGETLDGAEVYSAFVKLSKNEYFDFNHKFTPENSEPTQTI